MQKKGKSIVAFCVPCQIEHRRDKFIGSGGGMRGFDEDKYPNWLKVWGPLDNLDGFVCAKQHLHYLSSSKTEQASTIPTSRPGAPKKPFSLLSESYAKRKLPEFETELETIARSSQVEDEAALLNLWFESVKGRNVLEIINSKREKIPNLTKTKQIELDEQLEENVSKLLEDMPKGTAVDRKTLISYLSFGLPLKYCAPVLSASPSSISAARSLFKEQPDKTLLFFRRQGGKRERITKYEQNSFKEFVETEAFLKGKHYENPNPIGQLYSKFLEFRKQKNIEADEKNAQILQQKIENGEMIPLIRIKSRKTFNKLLKELNVKKMAKNYSFMDCPYCKSGYKEDLLTRKQQHQDKLKPDSEISEIERGEVQILLSLVETQLKEIEIHKELMKIQREFEAETKKSLEEENQIDSFSCMIHFDFTSIEFEKAKCQRDVIEDFIIVIDWWNVDQDKWERIYLDYLCDDETKKASSSFVIQAFDQVLEAGYLDKFNKYYLFSDGGRLELLIFSSFILT